MEALALSVYPVTDLLWPGGHLVPLDSLLLNAQLSGLPDLHSKNLAKQPGSEWLEVNDWKWI